MFEADVRNQFSQSPLYVTNQNLPAVFGGAPATWSFQEYATFSLNSEPVSIYVLYSMNSHNASKKPTLAAAHEAFQDALYIPIAKAMGLTGHPAMEE
ncbi:MAG: hypothetical protein PHP20_05995 [Firmicutes bacterium]|jgi:hypothetical protein|nr:hypothetical protein [Bacillota bacterium]MDD4336881.1 hypothetical protein [Bacillota bacterium]MDD4792601.1 hypothetical protein [Bacillota bacterium]